MSLLQTLTGRANKVVVLTECPKGHERALTLNKKTPRQDWTLTCPLCGAEHRIIAPQILRSDV